MDGTKNSSPARVSILGLSSAPSHDGNTSRLVQAVLSGAENSGADVAMIHLPEFDIGHCRGCMSCLATGTCALTDDYEDVRRRILAADGLVLGSPTYGMTVNARMKALLERLGLFAVYTSLLADKYVVGISACGGAGARRTARDLTTVVHGFFGFGQITGILGVRCGWKPVPKRALRRAEVLGGRLAEDLLAKRRRYVQRFGSRAVSRMVAARMVKPNILANRHDRMKAVCERLVAEGKIRSLRR